jgi:hypothetical protein
MKRILDAFRLSYRAGECHFSQLFALDRKFQSRCIALTGRARQVS